MKSCFTMFVRDVALMSSRVSEVPIMHLKANIVERVFDISMDDVLACRGCVFYISII